MQRILGIINPIISTRSTRMFGTALPEDDVINVALVKVSTFQNHHLAMLSLIPPLKMSLS